MSAESRRRRGNDTPKYIAEAAKRRGWLHAEATPAGRAGSDVVGLVGIDVEAKATAAVNPRKALEQSEKRAPDSVNIAVHRHPGQGAASVDAYVASVRLGWLLDLLATHPDYRPATDPAHAQAVGLLLARDGTDWGGTRALPDPITESFRCVCTHPELPGAHSMTSCRLSG